MNRQLITELYDPGTGTWAATGNLSTARIESSTATLLGSGKVLIVGGGDPGQFVPSAELYDPNAGTWSLTGNMAGPRGNQGAVLLSDAEVIVAGGQSGDGQPPMDTVELYDPATGAWRTIPSMPTPRLTPALVLLSDGRVLVVGGLGRNLDALASVLLSSLAFGK